MIVLALKALAVNLFEPLLYSEWFVPFIKNFIASGYHNPWDLHLSAGGHPKAFPYDGGMLAIFSIPFAVKSLFAGVMQSVYFHGDGILMALPIIAADIGILFMLIKHLKLDAEKTVYIYWCSPVVFYISYLHGQLDIVPMAMLLASMVALGSGRYVLSALLLGAGIGTKGNLLFALPLMTVFVYRNEESAGKTALYVMASAASYFIATGWAWASAGYVNMVLDAEERSWLFLSKVSMGGFDIYAVLLVLGVIYLKFLLYGKVNRELLIMYVGLAYTVLLILIPSGAPGWYMWVVPFLCYYHINSTGFNKITLGAFSILFVLFFVFTVPYPLGILMPGIKSTAAMALPGYLDEAHLKTVSSILYTLLVGVVSYTAALMYAYGVRSNSVYKERRSPVIIGIGGNSGAGKDTLCNSIRMMLGERRVMQADCDDHHRWERGHGMWNKYTHLNPKANDLFAQYDQALALSGGRPVLRRRYDHNTGRFTEPAIMKPNEYVLISGLHPYYIKSMREIIDIKVFVDTEESLRAYWKTLRDLQERGYTKAEVLKSMSLREDDGLKFIEPQKMFADVIVRYEPLTDGLNEITSEAGLKLVIHLKNSINIEYLVKALEGVPELIINHRYAEYDWQTMTVSGDISSRAVHEAVVSSVPNMFELAGRSIRFEDGLKGIVQAVLLCVISHVKSGRPAMYTESYPMGLPDGILPHGQPYRTFAAKG